MPRAFCELNEKGTKICVFFAYDAHKKEQVKAIHGSRFVGKDHADYDPEEGVHWTVPLDLSAAEKLRDIFGHELVLGNAVRTWGREERQRHRNLSSLVTADDAKLVNVPRRAPIIMRIINGDPIPEFGLPKKDPLNRRRPARPYQRADIAMMAQGNVLNANQPGTGKTLEVLGALVEAELEIGPHLVVAPRTSLVNTWKVEVERVLGQPVFTSEDPHERRRQMEAGLKIAAKGGACWILGHFGDFRVKKACVHDAEPELKKAAEKNPLFACKDYKGNVYHFQNDMHKRLVRQSWNSLVIDELHKSGLNTADSLFTLGIDLVKAKRVYPMSGTPMGGKPIKLFPILRRIDRAKYSSKWGWAGEWLEVEDNGYGKKIGGIKPGLEDRFYEAHKLVMVRRMKREALPGLPPKVIEIVPCPMTSTQKKQYKKFDDDAEIRIGGTEGGHTIVGDCILAEFTRLKQFANAACTIDKNGDVVPTTDSGKLPVMLEKLEEHGIMPVKMRAGKPLKEQDYEPGARAIIGTQFEKMAVMVSEWLTKQGVPNGLLTGNTKDSAPIIKRFKNTDIEEPYVLVMTTQTGGVSLNLEEAGSVHVLDESWNPDDEEQLEDRGDRGTRDTPLVCYYYRTTGSIQEYIAEVAEGKKITNATALDIYRQMQKEMQQEEVAA